MDHWYSDTHFETKDELETQAEMAIEDYKELADICKKFEGLIAQACLLANRIQHPDVKYDVEVSIADIDENFNRISKQKDYARVASLQVWEEPENPLDHSTWNRIGTGCK
jgi:NAD+--asparagine ADP-ribosyltransferase